MRNKAKCLVKLCFIENIGTRSLKGTIKHLCSFCVGRLFVYLFKLRKTNDFEMKNLVNRSSEVQVWWPISQPQNENKKQPVVKL